MRNSLLRRFAVLSLAFVMSVGVASLASAVPVVYTVVLNGASEVPANPSTGTGTATVTIDATLNTMSLNVSFSGLTGTTTNCHIHAPTAVALAGTASVATTLPTFAGFPGLVNAGVYANTLDMTLATSYNPAYVTANGGTTATAQAALFAAIAAGKAYLNIHSNVYPGGEIRGFLIPQAVGTSETTWGKIKSMYK